MRSRALGHMRTWLWPSSDYRGWRRPLDIVGSVSAWHPARAVRVKQEGLAMRDAASGAGNTMLMRPRAARGGHYTLLDGAR
jgi:hypothetical protein